MSEQDSVFRADELLATILADENFHPAEPTCLEDIGLPVSLIESLILKRLNVIGSSCGRALAEFVCVPFACIERVVHSLRSRQLLVHNGSAPLNDYYYQLTDQGRQVAQAAMESCAYVGPAPVPLNDYIRSVDAQTIRGESPRRKDLIKAFENITIDEALFESLGPAINSGAGLFLYGQPGNGKSTLATNITMCFGQMIWIPYSIYEDGQIIKLYDAAYHQAAKMTESSLIADASYDQRWIKIKRPTVVVGGELTMDSLEIRHDPRSNVSEAPLQMKSNCGCLLIDDFGRQRAEPAELLNRWIIPLENRIDYLTLSTGKKIQVPFEQLIIFSTNLEPKDLVDEAFLRRIPYKIEIADPGATEFHQLFKIYAQLFNFPYEKDAVDYLLNKHYLQARRSLRRCHPRDLLNQIRNYCVYNEQPLRMLPEHFDRVIKSYFTDVLEGSDDRVESALKSLASEVAASKGTNQGGRSSAPITMDSSAVSQSAVPQI
jgi:TM2 domain-containing membrane protein YozV